MALGVQTQLGTRGTYSQKYMDSKKAFSRLKEQVSPVVEQGLIAKSVSNGVTREELLKAQIAYKKFELREFSMLEQMIEERVRNYQESSQEQVSNVQVSKMLVQIVNNKEKEVKEDLSI